MSEKDLKQKIATKEKELVQLRDKYAQAKKAGRTEGELAGIEASGKGVKNDLELYKRILLAHQYGTGKKRKGGEK